MPKNDLLESRRKPDRPAGRPTTPPSDPRVEAAKAWSTSSRQAARAAFEAATARGAGREAAIEAGHEAGLRHELAEEGVSEAAIDLVAFASSAFGVSRAVVVPPPRSALEQRCFELSFPDHGIPETEPATPATTARFNSADEAEKAAGKALASELSKGSERKGSAPTGRRTA